MNKPIRGVVFDLDGTLIDSMPLVFRAYAHAIAPFLPAMTDEQLSVHMGGPPEKIMERLLSEPAEMAEALRRLTEFGKKNWALARPFDGMRELLEDLRAAGCAIAIWTGRDRASTELLLKQHGVEPLIAACICGDDLPSHKPDPAGLAEALRLIGVGRDEAIFVGDHEVDVLAGAALGVPTLLITHGEAVSETLRAKAWRVVETTAEAYALVRATAAGNRTG